MSSTSTVHSLRSRPLKREDEYYRRSYHSRSSNPERRSHRHRSSRHRSRRSRRYRSSSSRYSRSRSSSRSSSRSRSRSRSRSNRRRRRRRRKYSTSTSRSPSDNSRHESNNYNKDKQYKSSVNNNNNNNNNSESKEDVIKTEINKPTTRGKPWEDWEEALITCHTNQIINDRNECKTIFKEENWKSIALKLECETRTKINCTDLIGRSWQAVQSRYYALRKRKRNGKETVKNEANDENNNCELKMEFVEKPIKSEHTKNKKRNKGNKVKYEEKNIDNEDEMIAICKLLGIASLKTGIQIYGHYSHLAIYKKVLDLVATDDENERSFKLNNLTSSQLRDIVSKTKSKCKIGSKCTMRDAIQQKIKEFRENYLKNAKKKNLNHVTENDNDNNSSNEVSEPAQKENDDGDSSGSSSEGESDSDSESESESGSDSESSIDTVSQSQSQSAGESEIYVQHKKEERKLLLESLHDSLKREYEKGVRLLCNMRISDNEDLQMRYTNLLKKHTPVLKEINIEMFNHQNIDMREGINNIKL